MEKCYLHCPIHLHRPILSCPIAHPIIQCAGHHVPYLALASTILHHASNSLDERFNASLLPVLYYLYERLTQQDFFFKCHCLMLSEIVLKSLESLKNFFLFLSLCVSHSQKCFLQLASPQVQNMGFLLTGHFVWNDPGFHT